MLAYRSTSRRVEVGASLDDITERARRLGETRKDHDACRALLIDLGMLESALLDAETPECDTLTPLGEALGAVMGMLAQKFVRSWERVDKPAADLVPTLDTLRKRATAGSVDLTVPEGFAYYGLFPETYVGAARALALRYASKRAVIIGIRSIGTTLSAVVAASLAEQGTATTRITVRPRGHPFDRELCLSPVLTRQLADRVRDPATLLIVVDEGPGLSGSSFASVAECIAGLGAPAERIVLMPSWDPSPQALSSTRGQRCWARHARFIGDFDRDWIASGRLARRFGVAIEADLSAGAWRRVCYRSAGDHPPVQPQHEQRKLLARDAAGERVLLKFEGLGSLGRPHRDRACWLSGAGFGPVVREFADGFLATAWIEGRPMSPRDVDARFIDRVARYLAWLGRRERTGERADPGPLRRMIEVNVDEGLGPEWGRAVRQRAAANAAHAAAPAVRIDGRMMLHEWIRTSDGYVKTDGLAHHDDHFYPGATDIAWDVAGACTELELDAFAARAFIAKYRAYSGDASIDARLPFYRLAYLAFRLGYATLAAQALGASPDATGMRRVAHRCADALRRELSAPIAPWLSNVEHGQSYVTDT